jgi:predicted CXXCH cytochrome family protein
LEFGLFLRIAPVLLTLACLSGQVPAADIRGTPHNLTQQGASVEAEEVCVFCHTPQVSADSAARSGILLQPAWQPSLSASHSFVLFDDIGRLQFGDKPAVGSQSIACLSCHDANQAFSVQASETDHPFGIPYRGYSRGRERSEGERESAPVQPAREAKELKSLDDFRLPSHGIVDNRTVWWVSASGVTPFRTRADLPLYARPLPAGEVPFVECSSCHDPHASSQLFLRVDNAGSRLCLTCHDK